MIWKPVSGFEGYYEVSNEGDIKSLSRIDRLGKPVKGKILKKQSDRRGYETVTMSVDGKKTRKKVHRIVAEAFVSNPNNYEFVNHKDEDKKNNKSCNLEWCSRAYNMSFGTLRERQRISVSKPVYQYDENFNLVKFWAHSAEACDKLGLNINSLRVISRRQGKYKGYYWSREKIE